MNHAAANYLDIMKKIILKQPDITSENISV